MMVKVCVLPFYSEMNRDVPPGVATSLDCSSLAAVKSLDVLLFSVKQPFMRIKGRRTKTRLNLTRRSTEAKLQTQSLSAYGLTNATQYVHAHSLRMWICLDLSPSVSLSLSSQRNCYCSEVALPQLKKRKDWHILCFGC